MDNVRYTLARAASLSVPVEVVDKLLDLADGNAALLYLHILRRDGTLSVQDAVRELSRTEREITAAAEVLKKAGLLSDSGKDDPRAAGVKPAPADEIPEYSSEDIARRAWSDAGFSAVVAETQRIYGRMLSGADLKTLFGIYDFYGLPPEVMLLLINHCVSEYRERSGGSRLPTMRSIGKTASVWANNELLTLDRAEEYLNKLEKRKENVSLIKQALNIYGRELSSSELKYIESWDAMGFTPEALAIAYDRTVLRTGSLQWRYMDTIVTSWHQSNLHTPEEIAAGDAPLPSKKRSPVQNRTSSSQSGSDLDRLERILKK